jgi:hypothetical protein
MSLSWGHAKLGTTPAGCLQMTKRPLRARSGRSPSSQLLTRVKTYNLIDGLTPGCYPHQLFHLLRHRRPAQFATYTDAQRAADAYELDQYPNAKVIDDRLSWFPDPEIDWRSIPHLVEGSAKWERSALVCIQSRA